MADATSCLGGEPSVHVEIVQTIRRPIGEVFDRLVDVNGYSEWMPRSGLFVTTSKDSEGPVQPALATLTPAAGDGAS